MAENLIDRVWDALMDLVRIHAVLLDPLVDTMLVVDLAAPERPLDLKPVQKALNDAGFKTELDDPDAEAVDRIFLTVKKAKARRKAASTRRPRAVSATPALIATAS